MTRLFSICALALAALLTGATTNSALAHGANLHSTHATQQTVHATDNNGNGEKDGKGDKGNSEGDGKGGHDGDGDKEGNDGDEDDDNGNGKNTQNFGPFPYSQPDNGSCGNAWANDTANIFYTVRKNSDGTFSVVKNYRNGKFVTIAGQSPGACETTDTHHGHTVNAGIKGEFTGFLAGVVTGGTFNPNGCSAAGHPDCSTTSGFIGATFGSGAMFSCSAGFANCTFDFRYHSGDKSLIFHDWRDASDNHGGELFQGDIANA